MAFIPHTPLSTSSLLPVASGLPLSPRRPTARPCRTRPPRRPAGPGSSGDVAATRRVVVAVAVRSADAMEFFRHREGRWSSWRVTHHLAFQRAESGESDIEMQVLDADDERIIQLCKDWEVDIADAQGGCYVTWHATMAWDQEGENHEGATVFALVPDKEDKRRGRILRDRGYAEIVPIAGTYYMDDADALNLETPYEGGAVEETFSFDGPNVVNRSSTVRRFGGLSTATFSTEQRLGATNSFRDPTEDVNEAQDDDDDDDDDEVTDEEAFELINSLALFGPAPRDNTDELSASSAFTGRPRWTTGAESNATPATSAFGSGFSGSAAQRGQGTQLPTTSAFATGPPPPGGPPTSTETQIAEGNGADGESGRMKDDVQEMAEKAGIDLSKVPPSMRNDFLASLQGEAERKG